MKLIMKKTLIGLFVCVWLPTRLMAWGAEGHMVIAQIAYNHLDPAVKAQCDALIAVPLAANLTSTGTSNFVTAAAWADDFKSTLTGSGIQHYIDLPFSLDGTSFSSFVTPASNVVQMINLCISNSQNIAVSQSNQAVGLRYLIHFVGDIQQPLHCSTAFFATQPSGDGGGNGFTTKGTWSNLHSLWDAGGGYLTDSVNRPLSAASKTTLSNKVAAIEADYPYTRNVGTVPDPMDWAVEGKGVAQTVSYVGITNNTTPTTAYLNTAMATTEQRMALGGHRLADLLNTLFSTNTVDAPVASFTATPTNGVAALAVTFTDTSTGSITNWAWTFGDGGTTNAMTASVAHTYNTPGVYGVTEIVSGSGGVSTNTVSNYITVLTPPPVAHFTATPTNGGAALTVNFTDTSSGSITNWAWTFGDGGTTNLTTSSVVYTYNTPGNYSVTEIVQGPGGWSTNTVSNYITVLTPPPVAGFTGTPTTGVATLAVTFTDNSSGSITNWSWTFGDGGTANLTTAGVAYTYTAPGTYDVTEIVTGAGGSSTNKLTGYITVSAPPTLPTVQVTQGAGGIVLTWSTPTMPYQLLSAPIPSGPWLPDPATLSTNGGSVTATISPANAQSYYRLQGQ